MPQLEHIGIAIEEVEAVIECFNDLLGIRPYKTESVAEQQVRTHFLDAKSGKLEFLESLDEDSAVQRFLDRRGEGLHHLAFEVDDADATMERLRAAEFTLLSESPRPGADDKRIFFVHPKETHGVLVEFCESTPADWSPHYVSRGDRPLATYERGDESAPPLVLLHGTAGTTCRDLGTLMRHLESQFHLVGIDLSGHGASSLPPGGTLTMNHFVEDVRTAIKAYDLSSVHLFGFSLGSAVALQCAHAAPDCVKRLALMSPHDLWSDSYVSAMKDQLDTYTLPSGQSERFHAHHEHADRLLSALQDLVDALPAQNDHLKETLSDITTPTLVVGLDEDPLIPVDTLLRVHETLPNARLSILPGTQHDLARGPISHLSALLKEYFSEGPA